MRCLRKAKARNPVYVGEEWTICREFLRAKSLGVVLTAEIAIYQYPDDIEFVRIADSDSAHNEIAIYLEHCDIHVDVFTLSDGEDMLSKRLLTGTTEHGRHGTSSSQTPSGQNMATLGEDDPISTPHAKVMTIPNRKLKNVWKEYQWSILHL